ncbi:hypothetical protein EJV46_16140 [Roseococcus sp. SYP-B2431]|uniref:hypothetical protein n=1 Tax=Roseococcus sp. SYP-B2431 TaxID=2496640 RepID=UPI00103BBF99|nr:hypothetical protein [Roseococcus sp. SYP-B2431]TCH97646.1 hypothetical protein EJV46_16140 [Roseococcus sp. SYP-B2431]
MSQTLSPAEAVKAATEARKPWDETARKGEEIASNFVRDGLKMVVLLNSGAALAMPAVTAFIGFDAAAKAALVYPMGIFIVGVIAGLLASVTAYLAMCFHIEASRADAVLTEHQALQFFRGTFDTTASKDGTATRAATRDRWWKGYSRLRGLGLILFGAALLAFVGGALWVFLLAMRK